MNIELKEAIEVLKRHNTIIKGGNIFSHFSMELYDAIDTVVEYSEKQLPCDCVIGFEGDIPVTHKLCDNCKSKIWE